MHHLTTVILCHTPNLQHVLFSSTHLAPDISSLQEMELERALSVTWSRLT